MEWPNAPTSKGAVRAENGPTGTVVKPLPGGKYLFQNVVNTHWKF